MPDTLLVNPISPFARKAMILNRISGLGIEEVVPDRNAEIGYRPDINPLGKIPALRLADGRLIVDSPVICEYLDRTIGLLTKADDPIAAKTLHAIGDGLASAVYDYRYETVRDQALHWTQMIHRKTEAIQRTLHWLNDNVEQLSASELCWGGLAVGCALDYCSWRAPHVDWRGEAPQLAKWYETVCTTPVWLETNAYADAA